MKFGQKLFVAQKILCVPVFGFGRQGGLSVVMVIHEDKRHGTEQGGDQWA